MTSWGKSAVVVAVVLLALTACSSPADQVGQFAKQAASAEQSAAAGTELFRAGKALAPEISTLFQDSMKELNSAEQGLAQIQATGHEATLQHTALTAVRDATDALLGAQRELDSGALSARAEKELRSSAAALKKAESP
jgi:hypothetical protein